MVDTTCKENDNIKVFSFGVGSGCSKGLVDGVAKYGRGEYSIIKDNDSVALKAQVI